MGLLAVLFVRAGCAERRKDSMANGPFFAAFTCVNAGSLGVVREAKLESLAILGFGSVGDLSWDSCWHEVGCREKH